MGGVVVHHHQLQASVSGVGASLGSAWPHRHRLGSVQRLNLAFSSTHNPTMSVTLATNSGSVENSNFSLRHRCTHSHAKGAAVAVPILPLPPPDRLRARQSTQRS